MPHVLVLNQNYEPLNVCAPRRAFVLVETGRADVLELNGASYHSERREWRVPSVIRLNSYIKRPRVRLKLSRREIFARDKHTCQYCGQKNGQLTLDHVTPRHQGGEHSWENLVTACRPCNHKKGGKTVAEAKLTLRAEPREPYASPQHIFGEYLQHYDVWKQYIG